MEPKTRSYIHLPTPILNPRNVHQKRVTYLDLLVMNWVKGHHNSANSHERWNSSFKSWGYKNAVSPEQQIWIFQYRYVSQVFQVFFFHSSYLVSVTVFAHCGSDAQQLHMILEPQVWTIHPWYWNNCLVSTSRRSSTWWHCTKNQNTIISYDS